MRVFSGSTFGCESWLLLEADIRMVVQFREEVPGIHLRTTLMVGHPGETEADFEELKEFVRKVRFEDVYKRQYISIFRMGKVL